MKIVIDIPEEVYKSIQDNDYCEISNADMYNAIKKGTPLDMAIRALKNEQTDGDLISREIEKADFLMAKVKDFERTAIRVKHNTEIIDRLIDYIHGVIVNAEKDHFVIDEERKCALREKFKLPSAEKTDGDLITEIDKLPRIKVGNSNSPTVKYCIDEVLLYDLLDRMKGVE